MDEKSQQLNRGLKNRHIQLIALGGAIGTGLFLGIADTIKMAGPAVLLGYAIAGFIAFLIMRQLGEMVVEEPVAGSFSHFAYKYWGNLAGFISGWNYWVLYILVSMAELSAVGKYVQYWYPNVPLWVSALVFFVVINLINLTHVKLFGEMEFWFAIIKVIAIICMILFGAYLLTSGAAGPQASISNLWSHGGFVPKGWHGVIMSLAIIMFSFGGLELVGITAAESDQPRKTIPKATNQVIYRILIFYIGALGVLLSLYPWDKVIDTGSPFVLIFHALNSDFVANILNIIVLTAALSVYNSSVYCNSRMLFGLAQQGNAPKFLLKVNRKGIPVIALSCSALIVGLCVLLNYFAPKEAFGYLMSLTVSALVINWAMISFTHLKFRKHQNHQGKESYFPSLFYPWSNILCLLFMVLILVIMLLTPGQRICVYLLPAWVILLAICFFIKPRSGSQANSISSVSEN